MIKNLIYIITATLLSGCNLFFRENPENVKEENDYPLEMVWSSEEFEEMFFSVQTQPVIENGLVYLVKRMDLVCMKLEDGKEVWKTDLEINTSIFGSNIIYDEHYLYLHHSWVKKFEKKTGKLVWEKKLPYQDFYVNDLSLMDEKDGQILIGGEKSILLIDKETGNFNKLIKIDHLVPENEPVESYGARQPVFSPEGLIYAPVGYYVTNEPEIDGNMLCFDGETGELKWGFEVPRDKIGKAGASGCALFEDLVIFSSGQWIFALNRFTGEKVWERFFQDDAFDTRGSVYDGKLYIGSTAEPSVYCIDARSGDLDWRTLINRGSIHAEFILKENGKIFLNGGGQILLLDANTGELLVQAWPPEFQTNNNFVFSSELAIGEDRMVNVGSRKVYCMKLP